MEQPTDRDTRLHRFIAAAIEAPIVLDVAALMAERDELKRSVQRETRRAEEEHAIALAAVRRAETAETRARDAGQLLAATAAAVEGRRKFRAAFRLARKEARALRAVADAAAAWRAADLKMTPEAGAAEYNAWQDALDALHEAVDAARAFGALPPAQEGAAHDQP